MTTGTLTDKVDDMFAYLEQHNGTGTIECEPGPGEEGAVLAAFLERGRNAKLCVHAQVQHGWILFHAHPV